MRNLIFALMALFGLSTLAAVTPVQAQDEVVTGFETKCTPHNVEFNTFDVEDDKKPDGTPYAPPQYPGQFTSLFGCQVAGHFVRMNFVELFSQHMCGAMGNGIISVWVDGQQVVNAAGWNDHAACITQVANGHPPAHTLTRVIVNDRMQLTTCYSDVSYNEKTFDTDVKGGCTLQDLSGLTPAPASPHYGPIKLTPDRLLLAAGDPVFCSPLTKALNGAHTDDGPLAALPEINLPATLSDDQRNYGWTQAFTVDVDNDGAPDTVTYEGKGRDFIDGYAHDFTWGRDKAGKPFSVRDTWPADEDALDVDSTDAFRFVRINRRIYAYQVNQDLQMESDPEPAVAAGYVQGATRHLVELHNDGRITETCAWRPALRPEETF